MHVYTDAVDDRCTPQTSPLFGRSQVQNHAGGFVFAVDDWTRFDRFLVLGSEGGTFYVKEQKLTLENANVVLRCLRADGPRTVRRIVEISEGGRAPKNDPAIFALVLALKLGDAATRAEATEAFPRVCRIGTHVFHAAAAVRALGRGFGRGTRRAFNRWYTDRPVGDVAYDSIKYQQRDGWSHRDVLELVRPRGFTPPETRGAVFHWITRGWESVGDAPHPDAVLARIWAFERCKQADEAETIRLVRDYSLPWECVASRHLNSAPVWEALLPSLGLTAVVRNLAKMTVTGFIGPLSAGTDAVVARLGDVDEIRRARLHPLAILVALRTYAAGHGDKGALVWTPEPRVVDALDRAFYASFQTIEPTGKRWLFGVDVSGSMSFPASRIAGTPIFARDAAAALALLTASTESQCHVMGFADSFRDLGISPRQRLDDVLTRMTCVDFGSTDCALPMVYARERKIPVDVFVVLTDSETYVGPEHPTVALRRYRTEMGLAAKLIVVGMVATEFTIADPHDAGMLDVVGFDTATPQVMADFAR